MQPIQPRFVGVELYFNDLEKAEKFYEERLGLQFLMSKSGHHVQFDSAGRFICLERKGAESYPSKDKAVWFFEVPSLKSAIAAIGPG